MLPVDAPFGGEVGDSIAVDGDTIVAGAYDGVYAAYVFQRTGVSPAAWNQVAALAPQTPAGYPHNKAVAIHGDTVAVSTPRFASVYLFKRDQGGADQWGQTAALEGTEGSAFGKAISLYGDILAVGEPSETSNGTLMSFCTTRPLFLPGRRPPSWRLPPIVGGSGPRWSQGTASFSRTARPRTAIPRPCLSSSAILAALTPGARRCNCCPATFLHPP